MQLQAPNHQVQLFGTHLLLSPPETKFTRFSFLGTSTSSPNTAQRAPAARTMELPQLLLASCVPSSHQRIQVGHPSLFTQLDAAAAHAETCNGRARTAFTQQLCVPSMRTGSSTWPSFRQRQGTHMLSTAHWSRQTQSPLALSTVQTHNYQGYTCGRVQLLQHQLPLSLSPLSLSVASRN